MFSIYQVVYPDVIILCGAFRQPYEGLVKHFIATGATYNSWRKNAVRILKGFEKSHPGIFSMTTVESMIFHVLKKQSLNVGDYLCTTAI